MTPQQFLHSKGINLNACSLICYIDGYMRQPDLLALLEEYATLKSTEGNLPLSGIVKTELKEGHEHQVFSKPPENLWFFII